MWYMKKYLVSWMEADVRCSDELQDFWSEITIGHVYKYLNGIVGMTGAVSGGIMFKMYERWARREWQQTRAEVDTLITSDLFSTSPAGSRCRGCQQGQKTLIKLCPEPRLVLVRTPGSCSSLPRPRWADCFNLDTAPQFRDGDDTRRCCLLPWQTLPAAN